MKILVFVRTLAEIGIWKDYLVGVTDAAVLVIQAFTQKFPNFYHGLRNTFDNGFREQ